MNRTSTPTRTRTRARIPNPNPIPNPVQAKPVTAAAADNLLEAAMGSGKSGKAGAAVAMIGTLFKALNTAPPAAAADGDGAAAPAISAEEKEAITKAGMGALDQALGSMTATPEAVSQVASALTSIAGANPTPNLKPDPSPNTLTRSPPPSPLLPERTPARCRRSPLSR